jgi:F-type H+-transporting ATPase subunit epsilon
MPEIFKLEIISPDKTIFKSDVSEVTIPSFEGLMGILKNHIPLVTFLRPGVIVIKSNNEIKNFFIEEGTVEFSNNTLLILSSTAKDLENLSKTLINEMISDAREKIRNENIKDKEKYFLSYKIETLQEVS